MTDREHWEKMLPIIQAYVNGQTVQYKGAGNDSWEDIEPCEGIGFDALPVNYRIKPGPKYRPFATKEECWNDMQNHQPFGWLKNKERESVVLIGN